MIVLDYPEWGCIHEYPDDWEFGGAVGADPRADPRWMPTTYEYLGKMFERVAITQTPLCDHEAIANLGTVNARHPTGPDALFISAARPPNGALEMIYSNTEDAVGV